jgi:hypothetical protein
MGKEVPLPTPNGEKEVIADLFIVYNPPTVEEGLPDKVFQAPPV